MSLAFIFVDGMGWDGMELWNDWFQFLYFGIVEMILSVVV